MAYTSNSSAVSVLNINSVVGRPSYENIVPSVCTRCTVCVQEVPVSDNISSPRMSYNCKKAVMEIRSDLVC